MGTDLPPSCSGSRARRHWPVRQTGAADAHWHAGGPAPPAGTGPGWAQAASPTRDRGHQGLEASSGPIRVMETFSNSTKDRGGRGGGEHGGVGVLTAGLKEEPNLAWTATRAWVSAARLWWGSRGMRTVPPTRGSQPVAWTPGAGSRVQRICELERG